MPRDHFVIEKVEPFPQAAAVKKEKRVWGGCRRRSDSLMEFSEMLPKHGHGQVLQRLIFVQDTPNYAQLDACRDGCNEITLVAIGEDWRCAYAAFHIVRIFCTSQPSEDLFELCDTYQHQPSPVAPRSFPGTYDQIRPFL